MEQMCDVVKDLLPLYADGLLSDETRRFVEQHLQECESCRHFFDKYFIKLERKAASPRSKEDVKTIIDPFKKLRKMNKKAVLLSIVITVAAVFCLFWGYVLCEAAVSKDWTGMDSILGIDHLEVISRDSYTQKLRDMIVQQEGWNPEELQLKPVQPSVGASFGDPEGNQFTFHREVVYQGESRICIFYAHEYFAGCFRLTGYEFGELGEDGKTVRYSKGSMVVRDYP